MPKQPLSNVYKKTSVWFDFIPSIWQLLSLYFNFKLKSFQKFYEMKFFVTNVFISFCIFVYKAIMRQIKIKNT